MIVNYFLEYTVRADFFFTTLIRTYCHRHWAVLLKLLRHTRIVQSRRAVTEPYAQLVLPLIQKIKDQGSCWKRHIGRQAGCMPMKVKFSSQRIECIVMPNNERYVPLSVH